MNKFNKALVGTAAATAMAVSASPAMANDGHHHKKSISTGEAIAGVAILGTIAAIAASGKKKRYHDRGVYHSRHDRGFHNGHYRGHDRGYRGGRYHKGHSSKKGYRKFGPRRAVNKCINAAEYRAGKLGPANVTEIRDVDRTRYGYVVKGRILVKDGYKRRGYGRASYDRGRFTCYLDGRRVSQVKFRGLKGYY